MIHGRRGQLTAISIITPFHNAAPWLKRCLESVHQQEGDFEYILVNDHSDDNSRNIAKEYENKDERFFVFDNENIKGVSGARNTGIEHSSSKWITFLDADDKLNNNAIEIYARAAELGYNMVQMNHLRYYTRLGRTRLKYTNEPGEYTCRHLPNCWCMVWNKLYNRDFIGNLRFSEGMQYGEDELFNLECLSKDNRIYCIFEQAIIHCFDNKQSLSRSITPEKLLYQAQALHDFIVWEKNPSLRREVCKILSEHYGSMRYLDTIGPE